MSGTPDVSADPGAMTTENINDTTAAAAITEQLDKLKADKAFLFADGDEPTARIDTGLDHGSATETTSDAQARAVMGLPATK